MFKTEEMSEERRQWMMIDWKMRQIEATEVGDKETAEVCRRMLEKLEGKKKPEP